MKAVARSASLLAFVVVACAQALTHAASGSIGSVLQHALVWDSTATPGAYVVVRGSFMPPASLVSPRLAVFADSRYVAYVNGIRVSAGPERFDWRAPTYDTVELSFTPGERVTIVLLAHNYDTCGGAAAPGNMPEVCVVADPGTWWLDTPSGRFMNHVPGVGAVLFDSSTGEAVFSTAAGAGAWRTSSATRYGHSRSAWGSVPDAIDGRVDGGDASWERPEFDDSSWALPVAVDGSQWGPLAPRGVPRLRYTPMPLHPAGHVTLSDASPSAVFDAGLQVLATVAVALASVSAPGLVLTLQWFERRNATTGVLSHSYSTSTYTTAGAPSERFETVDVFGGRYVSVTLSAGANASAGAHFSVTLTSVNATDARYPYDLVALFDVPSEPFFARLFTMAAATLSINAADAYTDCSTRERAEWLGDAVLNEYSGTRLAFATREDDGSTTYADTRLLRGVLKRAALSSRGFYPTAFQVRAHTASDRLDFNGVWSDYPMAAVTALARMLAVTGDDAFVRAYWPDWRAALLWVMGRVQAGSGLGLFRETIFFTDALFLDITCGTALNAFAFSALSDGAAIAAALGLDADASTFGAAAAALRSALVARAYNESIGAFNAGVPADSAAGSSEWWVGPGGDARALSTASGLATYVALARGVLDADSGRAARAAEWLIAGGGAANVTALAGAPMTAIQLFTALYRYGGSARADAVALNVIRQAWAEMVAAEDVGTLWEMLDDSGEVSHNMGASPLPFLLERVLGVTTVLPISPTHRVVAVEPHLGDLPEVRGVTSTEFGPVGVTWAMTGGTWQSRERAVALAINVSVAAVLPLPARATGLSSTSAATALTVSIAIPLEDAETPPPPSADALAAFCLALSGATTETINVTRGLASGVLTLDNSRRYLRFDWAAVNVERDANAAPLEPPSWLGGPPLRGLAGVDALSATLSAPEGGCP